MCPSIPQTSRAAQVNSLDDVRPVPAKAGLTRQAVSIALTAVVKDALQRHYGSLKAAAISLGIDPGQLTRELTSGAFKFERLERADAEAQAFVVRCLHEAFADADPKAQARRLIREGRRVLDELAEVVNG